MGKFSRDKGKRFERWVARVMRELFPSAARGWQYRSGDEMADVINVGPFWIECKNHRQPSVWAALKQAEEASPVQLWPTAVVKRDHERAIVVMRLDDWLELVKEWKASVEQ